MCEAVEVSAADGGHRGQDVSAADASDGPVLAGEEGLAVAGEDLTTYTHSYRPTRFSSVTALKAEWPFGPLAPFARELGTPFQ